MTEWKGGRGSEVGRRTEAVTAEQDGKETGREIGTAIGTERETETVTGGTGGTGGAVLIEIRNEGGEVMMGRGITAA